MFSLAEKDLSNNNLFLGSFSAPIKETTLLKKASPNSIPVEEHPGKIILLMSTFASKNLIAVENNLSIIYLSQIVVEKVLGRLKETYGSLSAHSRL